MVEEEEEEEEEGGFCRAREMARLFMRTTAWQDVAGQRPRACRRSGAER